MNKRIITEIFSRLHKNNPHPATELIYHNHFELLIAVMLSAHSTDKAVNKATAHLFAVANTPEKIVALGQDKVQDYIKTVGLYRGKAQRLLSTCEILITRFHSQVPNKREDLESLPGVGRKTANIILNECFGEPTLAVDTHILRVANRTGLAVATTPLMIEQKLLALIPKTFLRLAHHWLLLHGRYVCQARKPKCANCIIADLCQYPLKNSN